MSEVLETAADWFARRRAGGLNEAEQAALQAWLDESPDHASAFREIAEAWDLAGAVRSDPDILTVREQARRARPARRRLAIGAAIAASLAVAVFAGWSGLAAQGLAPSPAAFLPGQHTFRTGVGQTATVRLRDGSLVTLDTDSVVRAKETKERRILRLVRGRAYFKVAKDKSRPFTVAAGDKVVVATGTAFSVRLDHRKVEVTLVEGHVRVEEARPPVSPAPVAAPEAAEMKAGSVLVAAGGGQDWKLSAVDTRKAVSWMDGQLIFEDRPLGEAAAELNRYSAKKIIVQGEAISAAPIVSVVRTGDVDGFVRVVTAAGFARVVSDSDDAVVLAAPKERIAKSSSGEVHDF